MVSRKPQEDGLLKLKRVIGFTFPVVEYFSFYWVFRGLNVSLLNIDFSLERSTKIIKIRSQCNELLDAYDLFAIMEPTFPDKIIE